MTPRMSPSITPRIDGHLDLAYLALQGVDLESSSTDRGRFGVNFPALQQGQVRLACATLFTQLGSEDPWGYPVNDDGTQAARAARLQLRIYQGLEARGVVRIVRNRSDLAEWSSGPLRIVLLMEGADPIQSPQDAAWWFEQGVRMVGLTWALGSRWAGGNGADGPLTSAGRDLVQAFDAIGILHDASHLSRNAFDGLMQTTERCVVASHSNSATLTGDLPRHLTDSQLKSIAQRNGVAGLNLCGAFLAQGRPATLADAVAHVLHVRSIAGPHAIAMGSDFDGGFTPLECPIGIQRPEEWPSLDAALTAAGLSEPALAGFQCANWLRVLRSALPA